MDEEAEAVPLIEFVNSFDFAQKEGGSVSSISDLADGFVFFQMLNELAEDEFPQKIFTAKKDRTTINQNFSSMLRALDNFFGGEVDLSGVNVNDIVSGDEKSIFQFFNFVVYVMVDCEDQQTFIGRVMQLSPAVQELIRRIVQERMDAAGGRGSDADHNLVKTLSLPDGTSRMLISAPSMESESPLSKSQRSAGEGRSRVTTLKADVERLMAEKEGLLTENTQLKRDLKDITDKLEELRGPPMTSRESMQKRSSDQARHRLEAHIGDLEKEIETLKQRLVTQEQQHKDELRKVQDEADLNKGATAQVNILQQQNEKYKTKIKDLVQLKDQNRELERQLEEAQNRPLTTTDSQATSMLRRQVDSYKQKMAAAEATTLEFKTKCSQLEAQLEKMAQQKLQLESKLSFLVKENDALETELSALRGERESLGTALGGAGAQSMGSELSSAAARQSLEAMREKVKSLEKENARLKATAGGGAGGEGKEFGEGSEKVMQLENELDDAKRAKERIEKKFETAISQNASLETKVVSLESELETAKAKGGGTPSKASNEEIQNLRSKTDELNSQVTELYKSKDELNKRLLEEKETSLNFRTTNAKLETQLRARESELERLQQEKASLVKASGAGQSESLKLVQAQCEKQEVLLKSRISNLEQQLQLKASQVEEEKRRAAEAASSASSKAEAQNQQQTRTLKQQLQLREAEITRLKHQQSEREKGLALEERLMSTAFHELGLRYQQAVSVVHKLEAEREREQLGKGVVVSPGRSR
uniref:Hook C-terminal domain-containing protein n=1 Tax=Chromera velia CCMP2878 TaxID=1169474 RepID=A0A0G4HJD7_9ALVE|eukprot:Cvel_7059.t1-p1 / transcript=Cvel_7059.t1 / gene=Cvel_7059 / organism=Chromera_velia_CCMP2878 / gene_product=Protein Hook homolog 3, putative / transcript_product=Protein Hook homolog 3, putative / location=Cvel_scaffold361:7276-16362(-) / protein_length=764 / sequence_SO=supercontig / SO=protein_coding / is_pseudo=false